jgi:hypothetical protein
MIDGGQISRCPQKKSRQLVLEHNWTKLVVEVISTSNHSSLNKKYTELAEAFLFLSKTN